MTDAPVAPRVALPAGPPGARSFAPLVAPPAAPPVVVGGSAHVLPGIGAALALAAACVAIALRAPTFPVLLVTIALGVVARTAGAVPAALEPGLTWTGRHVLRAGVVLLGLQLSVRDVVGLGAADLAVLVVTVATTFGTTLWLGRRLRVGRALTLLVATGFSICGAAAVAAMSPVADAEDDDVATAVALVTLYGSFAILVVPVLARVLGLDDRTAGLWAGMSVHEVAQVVAAAGAVSAAALSVAVVAKLARVVLLAPLVAVVGLVRTRRSASAPGAVPEGESSADVRRPPPLPAFVGGFLVAVLVRSSGAVPTTVLPVAHTLTTVALGAAMVALGTQVHVARLARSGGRAVGLGAAATVVAMTVSLAGLTLVG